jgi:hypothetical protein
MRDAIGSFDGDSGTQTFRGLGIAHSVLLTRLDCGFFTKLARVAE